MKESETPDWYPLPPLVRVPSDIPQGTPTESSQPLQTQATDSNIVEKSSTSKLAGRLAYTPTFKDYPNGRISMRTQIAVHDEDGNTTFYGAYATKDYARRLRGKEFKKGDLVELSGVWQQNPIKRSDGSVQVVPVFYVYGGKIRGGPDAKPKGPRVDGRNPGGG